MGDIIYAYWLANIPGVGQKTIRQLCKYCGSAENVWHTSGSELKRIYGVGEDAAERVCSSRRSWDPKARWDELADRGISFISIEQENYPRRLRCIYDPPFGLYYIGGLPPDDAPSAGIVGARSCTNYGRDSARSLGKCLAGAGVSVISGLARGIDAHGHEGALDAGGRTFAMLGCGVNVVYPPEHARLYEQVAASGGILSEYPPDTPPRPGFFPMRNRIISAFSDVLAVIEAREKSGSLITADLALDQGKDVYALPGRTSDALSAGCNRLIRQGAGILLSPGDLLMDMGLLDKKSELPLEMSQSLVYSRIGLHPISMEKLCEQTNLDPADLAEILFELEDKGLVREVWQNHYASVN